MSIGAVVSSLVAIVLALALVLGLAWGVIWLLKKVQDRQFGAADGDPDDRAIRFVRALPLGQRERVAMVEVRGETLLLGVTAGGITLLARWPAGAGARSESAAAVETDLPARPGPRWRP